MLTAEDETPVLDNCEPRLPEEPSETNASTTVIATDAEVLTEQSTEMDAGEDEVSPITASLPSMLPVMMPDASWSDDEDVIEAKETDDDADMEDEGFAFDPFESILSTTTASLNLNLDPAVALALRMRTIEEIMAEDGLDHAEAIFKTEEEESIRSDYFRTESPERAEKVRLEKEALAQEEEAEQAAKRKTIADRAEHGLKARMFGWSSLVCGVLGTATAVASVLLGGA